MHPRLKGQNLGETIDSELIKRANFQLIKVS